MATVITSTFDDLQHVTNVVSEAFSSDPTWEWAIPDLSARSEFWNLIINSALRYPNVLRTRDFEAVSVWIPPNGLELTPEEDENLPDFIESLVGDRASDVLALLQLFDDTHPNNEPHYYLSLLATQKNSRGNGFGMELLKDGLARIDAENMPAYLESSNPINNHRYESVGFVPIGSFQAPGNGPRVTGMWRDRTRATGSESGKP